MVVPSRDRTKVGLTCLEYLLIAKFSKVPTYLCSTYCVEEYFNKMIRLFLGLSSTLQKTCFL